MKLTSVFARISRFSVFAYILLSASTYNNSNTKALKWQIRTLFEQGNYADAELYANRLIAINPKSPDGYAILGDIKLLMGKISESNDLHSKVIEIAPNYKIATKKKLN